MKKAFSIVAIVFGSIILFLFIIVVLFFVLLASCSIRQDMLQKQRGYPDKISAWENINQETFRTEHWQQIVTNSEFQLGTNNQITEREKYNGSEQYVIGDWGTYPNLDGSTVCVPMALEFSRQHLSLSDYDAKYFTSFSTTDRAYTYLITKDDGIGVFIASTDPSTHYEGKPIDLIIVTEPSDEELELAKSEGVELIIKPVCYDSFVFITHVDNPVDNLSVEQIRKIYSGEITNWKDVGGLDQEIKAFQREANSGSQTTMEKQVMQGTPMLPAPMVEVAGGMGTLVEKVGEYTNNQYSIGYTFKYYVDLLYVDEDIKIINVDGISPIPENMKNGTYPFTTNYFAVIRSEDKDAIGGKFMEWMLSDEGQRCIEQAGYCTMQWKL